MTRIVGVPGMFRATEQSEEDERRERQHYEERRRQEQQEQDYMEWCRYQEWLDEEWAAWSDEVRRGSTGDA